MLIIVYPNSRKKSTPLTKILQNRIKPYVNNQINNGNLLDASAKKAPKWFTTKELQLPEVVQTIIDANMIITQKTGLSIGSAKKISSGLSTEKEDYQEGLT